MPFSSKQIAEYSELINNELDKIPVNSIKDFALIANALQDIVKPGSGQKIPDELIQLKEFISSISDTCNDPELFYVPEAEFPEFQKIIQQRITHTINQLKKMSVSQKEAYIQNQQSLKTDAQVAASKMKNIAESKTYQNIYRHTRTAQYRSRRNRGTNVGPQTTRV